MAWSNRPNVTAKSSMNAHENAQSWIEAAGQDLAAIRVLQGAPEPHYKLICFLAQQVAEKSLHRNVKWPTFDVV